MDLKISILLFALFASSRAQTTSPTWPTTLGTTVNPVIPLIECDYALVDDVYVCNMRINNPNGLDDFTEVGGTHLENMTNADVMAIMTRLGSTANVPSIICSQFPNTQLIDFTSFFITAITGSSFSGCRDLTQLRLWNNRITSMTADSFANNLNLTYIDLDSNQLATLPATIFDGLSNLFMLEIRNNPFQTIPGGLFRNLVNLEALYMDNCRITTINPQWFFNLRNLMQLTLYFNLFTAIPAGSFAGLDNLLALDLGNSFADGGLQDIDCCAFLPLVSLQSLNLNGNLIRDVDPRWFSTLVNLRYIYLNFNQIEYIMPNTFTNITAIRSVNLWANRIKTLRRGAFGNLDSLTVVDLDSNVVNAMERQFFEDAVSLLTLYFDFNICASGWFGGFNINRDDHMVRLETCFDNFAFIVDTITEGGDDFSFYRAPSPGIFIRVMATENIQIALTPFDFAWNPMLEVIIGAANNTRSVIRRNQETDVVTVPTPNILRDGQWNDFRVIYMNHVILVFRGNELFPFMVHTMQDFYPVNFYGLRTPGTRGTWSVQPSD